VKPDAASLSLKYWSGEQMIEVYQHGGEQDKPVFFPVRFVVPVRDGTNEDEV
jgi:hypothetical protein